MLRLKRKNRHAAKADASRVEISHREHLDTYVEREVIANIMTICYTCNKKGLELIRAIPPLQALLKELEAAYDVSHG